MHSAARTLRAFPGLLLLHPSHSHMFFSRSREAPTRNDQVPARSRAIPEDTKKGARSAQRRAFISSGKEGRETIPLTRVKTALGS